MSGEVEVAYSAGRRNGTSAPYQRATLAIASLSVETTIRSKTPLWRAVSIAYASSGCPARRRTFFPGTRSEPPRAPIKRDGARTHGAGLSPVEPRLAAPQDLAEPAPLDLLLDLLDGRRAPEPEPRVEDDVLELARRPLAVGRVPLRPDADGDERLGEDVERACARRGARARASARRRSRRRGSRRARPGGRARCGHSKRICSTIALAHWSERSEEHDADRGRPAEPGALRAGPTRPAPTAPATATAAAATIQ